MNLNHRIWIAIPAFVVLVCATLFLIGYDIVAPSKVNLTYLAIAAVTWAFSITNLIRLRKMIAEQRQGRK